MLHFSHYHFRFLLSSCYVMVFALSAYSQSNNINALHQYLNPNLQKGIYASLQFDFNRSNEILEKINPEDFSKVDYVIAQMHLGSNLLWQLKYEQFNTLKEDLYRYCDENHLDQLKLRATILDALYLAHKRRFLPALNNLNASLNQYHLLYNQEHPDWYLWQPYLAFLYHFSQSDFLMSEKLYFSTIDRFDKAFSETIAITRVLELLQAILYHYQADIELAEQILLKNIQLCEADSFCSSSLLSTLNAWAATFEFNQNNYHEALPFINKAISSARTNFQITKALGVKNNYFGYIGNINACRNYFEEAKNHAMRLGVQEEYVQLVENYATVLAKNNQYSLIKELEIELDLLPQKEYKSSYGGNTYIPRILFWYCLEQKYFEQALVYYNKFLENSFQSVQETNGWKNLNIEKFPIHVNSPSVFYMKAKLAFEYWDKHKEVEKLQIAMDAALKCDSLFQLITSRFSNQHSIEKYLVEQDSYIDFFIGVSLQNYLTTTSHQNLQKLIYFISRSQDFDLFYSKLDKDRRNQSKTFSDFMTRKDSVLNIIQIENQSKNDLKNTLLQLDIQQKLFYTKIDSFKFHSALSLPENPDGCSKIIYYYNDDLLITIEVKSHSQYEVHVQKLEEDLNKLIGSFRDDIITPPFKSSIQSEYSNKLYSYLFKPLKFWNSNKKTLIITSKNLALLPFDALIYIQEKKLPNIYYHYQSNWTASENSSPNSTSKVFVFQPKFINTYSPPLSDINLYRSNYLGPLPYGDMERESIENYSQYKASYVGTNATFENLKEALKQQGVVHIISHAKQNLSDSSASFLAMSGTNITDIEKLPLSKLSLLTSNSEMIVLSACETGIGKFQNGIGLQSFAKAFMNAGSKSVISSLWSINDKSTALIMSKFYENLDLGMDKSDALYHAKLSFITENLDNQYEHPYYWSGIIATGEMRPFQKVGTLLERILGMEILLALLLLFTMFYLLKR